MSDRLQRLAVGWQPETTFEDEPTGEAIEVNAATAGAAKLYEKLRTTIDYQEEHLLRRNALLRILKRFLGSDVPLEEMSVEILKELIWAGYLPNRRVPVELSKTLAPILEKYEPLLRACDELDGRREEIFSWLLEVLATELEYAISPPYNDEALVSYMYEEMRERITWDPKMVISEEDRNMKLYIAAHRVLLKSNRATLRFRVLTLYYPDWPGKGDSKLIRELSENLGTIVSAVDAEITHPLTEKLSVLLRRRAALFRALGDVIAYKPEEFELLIDDPELLDRSVARALKTRTKKFRVRLSRTVIRAVLFLFLTKMLLALIIEVPYDLYVVSEVSLLPLSVNVLFHPVFLAFISLTVAIPEKKNSSHAKEMVRALVVGADHQLLNLHMKRKHFGTWSKIFSFVYALTFLFTYGAIAFFLAQFHFNWLSITLFLSFLSLVTFFGIRIRTSTKDIVVANVRSSIIGSLFDVFMLPVVHAGRWLSLKVSKINVFIYFFDFIIEAPFKVGIRFIENWFAFVKEKKEEI